MSEEGVLSAVCCTLRHFVTLPRLPQRVFARTASHRVCPSPPRPMSPKHWLMKAEPDSRIVKGKDVKVCLQEVAVCARLSNRTP